MADQTFPYIPRKNWWDLRRKFRQAMPGQVNEGYLAATLDISVKSAQNLLPSLRAVGLIDDNGKPLDRANEWRDDERYSAVCSKILQEVYPEELRSAQPPPNPNRTAIISWMMQRRHIGENAAKKSADFYVLLCQADPNADGAISRSTRTSGTRTRKPTMRGDGRDTNPSTSIGKLSATLPVTDMTSLPATMSNGYPSLHIDIQIHIAADASPEQIETVFASMAKHLYKRDL